MEYEKIIKSSQEQAVASWVSYLNKLRLSDLLQKLAEQDLNFEAAIDVLEEAKETIAEEIVSRNRGGAKGMHGFIAEILEVAFENAEKLVDGQKAETIWINNNGPVDIQRAEVLIQQKFVQNNFSLDKVREHLDAYPDFLKTGNKYQIPKDFYDKIKILWQMPSAEATRLSNSNDDGLTYSAWKKVQNFFDGTDISFEDLEPAKFDYADAQKSAVDQTLVREENSVRQKDQKNRDNAYQASKPTLKEGAQVTAVSAALEGGMAFCLGVRKKLKSGKKLHEFTADDWKDLGIDTVSGTAKGTIRGAGVYALTNYTATNASIASSLISAIFGVTAQAKKLSDGNISDEEFIINSESLCLEAAVSAVASIIGEVAIPIPVLGAIVGNTVGMFMYDIAKDYMSQKEQDLIGHYRSNMDSLNRMLDERYQQLINTLKEELEKFSSLLEWAFDPDVNKAFEGSVQLAQFAGVSDERILKSKKAIDNFFMV